MEILLDRALENLNAYLQTENLLQLSAVRPGQIWLDIKGRDSQCHEVPELTYDYWQNLCRILSPDQETGFNSTTRPVISSRLPDGHRFEAVLGQSTDREQFSVLIRLKPRNYFNFADFGLPEFLQEKLTVAVEQGQNILVSGGSESGKTTFLNCLIACRPEHRRIAVIDETRELEIPHPQAHSYFINSQDKSANWEKVVDQISKTSPDLIVVGEMRIDNTFPLIQLLSTNHKVMTTVHAKSCRSALEKDIPQKLSLRGHSSEGVADFLKETVDYVIHLTKSQEDNAVKMRVVEIWQPQTGYSWNWQTGESNNA